MSKQEYLQRLHDLLLSIPKEEREAALSYYRDYFEDAGEGQEERVIRELGSPEKVAAQIRDGLDGESDGGEFTEQGLENERYRDAKLPERRGDFQKGSSRESGTQKDGGHSEAGFFGREKESSFSGTEEPGGYGKSSFSGKESREQDGGREKKKGGGNSILKILLIVFLCIIALPVGLPLLLVAFVAGVCVLAVAFSLGISVLAAALCAVLVVGILMIVFGVLGVVFFWIGITQLLTAPPVALVLAGSGLLMLAFGLLMLLLVVWAAGTLLPALVRGTVRLFQWMLNKLLRRRGGQTV